LAFPPLPVALQHVSWPWPPLFSYSNHSCLSVVLHFFMLGNFLRPCTHYSMTLCWSFPEISFQNLFWDSLLPASQLHSHVCVPGLWLCSLCSSTLYIPFSSPYKTLDIGGTDIQGINASFLVKLTCFHVFWKIHTILASKCLADYHVDSQVSLVKILSLKQH
jgi:hypothetical protein